LEKGTARLGRLRIAGELVDGSCKRENPLSRPTIPEQSAWTTKQWTIGRNRPASQGLRQFVGGSAQTCRTASAK